MRTPSDLLRAVARSLRTVGHRVGDPWKDLADALERYADGTERSSDYLEVQQHSDAVLDAVFIVAEKEVIEEWLASLQEPEPNPPSPSA
jgi:hypothetical protein